MRAKRIIGNIELLFEGAKISWRPPQKISRNRRLCVMPAFKIWHHIKEHPAMACSVPLMRPNQRKKL
jgi:hypothetical protein